MMMMMMMMIHFTKFHEINTKVCAIMMHLAVVDIIIETRDVLEFEGLVQNVLLFYPYRLFILRERGER